MKITKLENNNTYKITMKSAGAVIYMLDGRFHRGEGQPALITNYSEEYFYRGVQISKEIAQGKLPVEKILNIPNMEIRQRAMEITGYESFLTIFTKIHEFTPEQFAGKFAPDEMYTLFTYHEKTIKEPIKILRMYDPSKVPFEKYFIRVNPAETDCKEAVAHSYKLTSYEDYVFCKHWV